LPKPSPSAIADAYERLLLDVVRSNQTLFMRRDEVEAAWQLGRSDPEGLGSHRPAVQGYTAGTWGPSQAIALIERDGRTWHEGKEPDDHNLHEFSDGTVLAEKLADQVAHRLAAAVEARGEAVIAVSGGSTPKSSSRHCPTRTSTGRR
jgi:hypothetical protein